MIQNNLTPNKALLLVRHFSGLNDRIGIRK